jgi:uncharacterized protein
MSRSFKGRVVVPGLATGEALVSHQGLNLLASFQKSALKKAKVAISADQNNTDIYNKPLTDKIICLPITIGSTTGGMVLQTVAKMGIAPKAFLFSQHIDSLAAAGVILSDIWIDKKIITVDQLGDEFLQYVEEGDEIQIEEDGTVIVRRE